MMVLCGALKCKTRIRSGQRGFDGLCAMHRKKLSSAGRRPRGPIGCQFCTKPKFSVMCARCTRDYDRWQRSPQNTGTHVALMEWVARRVRRYARLSDPATQQKSANRGSAKHFRSRTDDVLRLPA